MFIHCKPYRYNISKILVAVFIILGGLSYAEAQLNSNASIRPRIALLGDSMTWIGGDSCQNETGWSHILKESGVARAIDMYARSGATWTNTSNTQRNPGHYTELLHDDNVVYNQAIRLIERADTCDATPDLIILFAGGNDVWFKAKRPGIFDDGKSYINYAIDTDPSKVTSLTESIRLVYNILSTRFPNATLLFIAPLQMSKVDAISIHEIADLIEKTASEYGCVTLRADNDTGITHETEANGPTYTYDGVHTNQKGAHLLGNYILDFLISHPLSSPPTKTDNAQRKS